MVKIVKPRSTPAVIRTTILALLLAGLGVDGGMLGASGRAHAAESALKQLQTSGPIAFTDADGRPFDSDSDFAGRPLIVFFGYTYCPDVCPMSLWTLSEALRRLEADGLDTTPFGFLFVSVDPERDTSSDLDAYVSQFHRGLIGLHPDAEALARIAAEWRVTYARGDEDAAGVYGMSHTAYGFGLDRDHRVVAYLWAEAGPEKLAAKLRDLL